MIEKNNDGPDNNASGAQSLKIKRLDQAAEMRDADETPPQAQEPGELQEQLLDHLEREAGEPSAPNSSQSDATGQTQFFLYTKLNQNETKNLRKAQTNTEERRALAQIFGLKSILAAAPNESPSKTELLKLDFHAMNYGFCVENSYSNEKVSTLLAILDHVFQRMLEKQLKPEIGLKLLKDHLSDHSIQRPPHKIMIFTDDEVEKIIKFSLTTFLRHFSLYEFAFKPRVELVLRSDPVFNNKFNAELGSLDSMQVVEPDEAQRMKSFLGVPADNTRDDIREQDDGSIDQIQASQAQNSQDPNATASAHEENHTVDGAASQQDASAVIEWKKVGKVYAKDEDVMNVIASEMNRITKAFDVKLTEHTEHCVNTVNSGQSLVAKEAPGAPKKK